MEGSLSHNEAPRWAPWAQSLRDGSPTLDLIGVAGDPAAKRGGSREGAHRGDARQRKAPLNPRMKRLLSTIMGLATFAENS